MVEIEALVDGGKASAGPPLGPALGPLKVNIKEVIDAINEKTAPFAGMKVPVKVIVDEETREFEIKVGTPPASALIKKELGIEKGAQQPGKEVVGDLSMEQVIKIAEMKMDNMLTTDLKKAVKTIIGTCQSMGVTIEGKTPKEVTRLIDEGVYDVLFKARAGEATREELEEYERMKQEEQRELEERLERDRKRAEALMSGAKGKSKTEIKHILEKQGIHPKVIEEVLK